VAFHSGPEEASAGEATIMAAAINPADKNVSVISIPTARRKSTPEFTKSDPEFPWSLTVFPI
jgi:hypothetical protein